MAGSSSAGTGASTWHAQGRVVAVIAVVLVAVCGWVGPARSAVPTTFITVNGDGSARVLDAWARFLAAGAMHATRGPAAFSPGTWHQLSPAVSGATITARLDGQRLASLTDTTLTSGIPGITTGGWYPPTTPTWPSRARRAEITTPQKPQQNVRLAARGSRDRRQGPALSPSRHTGTTSQKARTK
jgi:hypothetical protein